VCSPCASSTRIVSGCKTTPLSASIERTQRSPFATVRMSSFPLKNDEQSFE
jgi:hypothetical protein